MRQFLGVVLSTPDFLVTISVGSKGNVKTLNLSMSTIICPAPLTRNKRTTPTRRATYPLLGE